MGRPFRVLSPARPLKRGDMAKISRKPQGPAGAQDAEVVNRFVFEGVEEDLSQPEPTTHMPNVDMYSTSSQLVIEVEMPGVRKDEIDLSLYKNNITIKALKFECFEEDKITYVCMERAFGRVFRTLDLPMPVDTTRIKALYKNGVLTIIIPRIQDKRAATRRVRIETT
jgi:HSP20 family protein